MAPGGGPEAAQSRRNGGGLRPRWDSEPPPPRPRLPLLLPLPSAFPLQPPNSCTRPASEGGAALAAQVTRS